MEKCWARSLGDCGTKLTGEHLVSEGMLEGPSVSVVGLPWCRDEPKVVGLGSLTSKVLCDVHNSRLSPVDQGGINAFRAIRNAVVLYTRREKDRPKRRRPSRIEIDGLLLERWALESALTLCAKVESAALWDLGGTVITSPPSHLVQAAYGLTAIDSPMGLYVAGGGGSKVNFGPHVDLRVLYKDRDSDRSVVGFRLTFAGLQFLLWCAAEAVPPEVKLTGPRDDRPWGGALHRHLGYVRFMHGRYTSHYLDIMWPEPRTVPEWVYRG